MRAWSSISFSSLIDVCAELTSLLRLPRTEAAVIRIVSGLLAVVLFPGVVCSEYASKWMISTAAPPLIAKWSFYSKLGGRANTFFKWLPLVFLIDGTGRRVVISPNRGKACGFTTRVPYSNCIVNGEAVNRWTDLARTLIYLMAEDPTEFKPLTSCAQCLRHRSPGSCPRYSARKHRGNLARSCGLRASRCSAAGR